MVTTGYPSSKLPSNTKEWLPLPRVMAIDDSFADDLIRQFDKKRKNLHKDLNNPQTTDSRSSTLSTVSSSISPSPPFPPPRSSSLSTATSHRPRSVVQPSIQTSPSQPPLDNHPNRRSTAGDLLRRSSAFFKATLDHTWKNISRSNDHLHNKEEPQQPVDQQSVRSHGQSDNTDQIPSLPATIAINTTITLPITRKTSQSSFPLLQPPVISQYPPKPLKYSPISLDNHRQHSLLGTAASSSSPHVHQPTRTLIHRISMPALRRRASNFGATGSSDNTSVPNTNEASTSKHRRKSDAPLFRRKKSSHP